MSKRKRHRTLNNEINKEAIKASTNDISPIIHQRDKLKSPLHIRNKYKLTENQSKLIELVTDRNTKIVFISGPAGTSKTYIAILTALQLLNEKRVSDLIYLRSVVESSESRMGFLPGTSEEKLSPYLQPLLDKLDELIPPNEIEMLRKEERIQGLSINFLRGLSWNAKAIVVDESQNMTSKELFTLITRVGEFSKLLILGDPEQSDLNGKSGFIKMMAALDDEESRNNGVFMWKFTEEDVVRSQLVKFLLKKLKNKY